MTRIWGIALLVGTGLLFAGASDAKTTHHSKTALHRVTCRKGYVRRIVWVPERKHGRIVRTFGLVVYTRVHRCVKVTQPKAPRPVQGGAGTALLPPPFAPIGSSSPFPPSPPSTPPPAPPANTAPPAISGNATQGSTLSASNGNWTNAPTSYSYQWQRCDASGGSCSPTGAAASTYPLTNADVSSTIRVSVTATNGAGTASATSAAAGPIASGASPGDPVVVAVGDIARPPGCSPCEQTATAALAQTFNPNAVLVLGDNQYDSGLYSEYTGSYALSWGQDFNSIVHPVPGNHEYAASSSAAGYFQYFGAAAHPTGGYYSFNLGSWHIIALNSDCSDSGCVDGTYGSTSTTQLNWLQSDLAHNTQPCVLAMWHHPLVSSGWTYGSVGVAQLWNKLYNAGADVVLNGHDHLYERYEQLGAAQTTGSTPSVSTDPNGIREFVVGTGGEGVNSLSSIGAQPQASASQFGVLVLTLHSSSYSWSFVNTSGTSLDSGTTGCNGGTGASSNALAARAAKAARVVSLSGPPLALDVRPLGSSLESVVKSGLPVAVHMSRAADVVVTVSLRHGRRLQRIASFYETESQIPGPYSRIVLNLPARRLRGLRVARLVLRFAAIDSAGNHRTQTTTVTLRSR